MGSVCIIDDDPVLQKIMHRLIIGFNDQIKVSIFQDGQDAIEGLKKMAVIPDLIFLDINMPIMNAWSFIEIYEANNFAHVPIYILSSSIDERDISRAKELKLVKEYLIKPLRKDALRQLLVDEGFKAEV